MTKQVVLYPRKIAASLAIHFNPRNERKWPPVIVTTDKALAEGQRRLNRLKAIQIANGIQSTLEAGAAFVEQMKATNVEQTPSP